MLRFCDFRHAILQPVQSLPQFRGLAWCVNSGANQNVNRENELVPASFAGGYVSLLTRSRSAFAMTETELKLIAAAAIIGLSRRWAEIGYSTPAAIGTPRAL